VLELSFFDGLSVPEVYHLETELLEKIFKEFEFTTKKKSWRTS
jgi:hypothetical protein